MLRKLIKRQLFGKIKINKKIKKFWYKIMMNSFNFNKELKMIMIRNMIKEKAKKLRKKNVLIKMIFKQF